MVRSSFRLFSRAYRTNAAEIRRNLVAAVLLELCSVGGLYILNQVYGRLYEGIQVYDTAAIWSSIGYFTLVAMLLVLVNGYLGYFINRLAFAIRAGLTDYELAHKPYAEGRATPNNYPQRVQEDFKKFAESSCDLWFAVLKSALYLPVFIGVIVSITQWYIGLSIVLAVVAGTVVTRIVAMRLVVEQSVQESNEANFRSLLTPGMFDIIKSQFEVLNLLFKRLSFTQAGIGQALVLLPFIVLMPYYLNKSIAMGAFMQSVNALGKIIDALSVLIDSRQIIVTVETTIVRLDPIINR